jgi:hypothetical protein
MRPSIAALAAALPLLAAVACGGRVGLIDDSKKSDAGDAGDGGCTDGCCPGDHCVPPPEAGSCPNSNGSFAGSACPTEGQVCQSSYDFCGTEETVPCTCETGVWTCPVGGGGCPAPVCPPQTQVVQGAACDTSLTCDSDTAQYDCNGNFLGYAQCDCYAGQWSCEYASPECPACQPPDTIYQGEDCFSPGLQCPGNPTSCDGAVFYDDFECDGGEWNDIAQTQCGSGSSGGSSSGAGSGGGGGAVDAGSAGSSGGSSSGG